MRRYNNIYIAGYSFSSWGSPIQNHAGEHDIAVLKLNASGQIQWNTFHGSGADDEASGICTDTGGNIYVAGFSASSWLGSSGEAPKHPYSGSGDSDIMVMKLNSNGGYQRHTFYGAGDLHDYARGIALDNNRGIYLAGNSPASWLGEKNTNPIHAYSGNNSLNGEGFILKLSDWYTYIPYIKR